MCEALVAARMVDTGVDFPDDPLTGLQWRVARGHFVDVKRDGWAWQAIEDPRNFATAADRRFALLRFPGVTETRIRKYLAPDPVIISDQGKSVRRRGLLWQIQWPTLPLAARNILIATGVLTIGPSGDFTWAQVQNFVVNLATGLGDAADLSG